MEDYDIDEYVKTDKKFIDCYVAHYSSIATVGLLLAAVIYVLRPYIGLVPAHIFGVVVGLACVSIFFLYSLYIVRLGRLLISKEKLLVYLGILPVLLLDMKILEMLVSSIPKSG